MKTKSTFPLSHISGHDLPALVEAMVKLNQLKLLYRQGWLRRGIPPERCETVAEHVYSMAMLAWWLADLYYPKVDRSKLLCMTLAHELGEIYTGDLVPSDAVSPEEKHRRERESLKMVVDPLPDGNEILDLWEEFEAGATPEARLARQLDRLEMAFQAVVYRSEGFSQMEEFLDSAGQAVNDAPLREILAVLMSLVE